MKPENAIEVQNVRKHFKVYKDKGNLLRERVVHWSRNQYELREVLKGISFDVKKGESVGLIGKNGCGKSTILKLLTKILRPNGGTIETQGRVCSLIELGAGFHPDMSGRENVYINASIFGINAKEVDCRMNDIIRFSELEEFIDNPVRTYSSGMYMRLAFSVAINVDADILLIDEILAVGDNAFQIKCFNKLQRLKEQGTTIVVVSHALGQVEQLCDRAIWIDDGVIRGDGPAWRICKEYLEKMEASRLERAELEYRMQLEEEERQKEEKKAEQKRKENEKRIKESCRAIAPQCGPDVRREGSGQVVFTHVKLLDRFGHENTEFRTGDAAVILMQYESAHAGVPVDFSIGITNDAGVFCYGTSLSLDMEQFMDTRESGEIQIVLEHLNFLKGSYSLEVCIQDTERRVLDRLFRLIDFQIVADKPKERGLLTMPRKWEVRNEQ